MTSKTDEILLDFEEVAMICTVPASTSPAQTMQFLPGASGLTRLDQFGQLYDQYRIEQFEVIYRSQVGATTNGFAVVSCDFNVTDTPANFAQTQAQLPRVCGKVWEDMRMNVPTNKLMKSMWHFTSAASNNSGFAPACNLNFHSTGTNGQIVGSIWLKYRVRFCGPTQASSSAPAVATTTYTVPLEEQLVATGFKVVALDSSYDPIDSMYGSGALFPATIKATPVDTEVRFFPEMGGNILSVAPTEAIEFTGTATIPIADASIPPPSDFTYVQAPGALPGPNGQQPILEVIESQPFTDGTLSYVTYTFRVVDMYVNMLASAYVSIIASVASVATAVAVVSATMRRTQFLLGNPLSEPLLASPRTFKPNQSALTLMRQKRDVSLKTRKLGTSVMQKLVHDIKALSAKDMKSLGDQLLRTGAKAKTAVAKPPSQPLPPAPSVKVVPAATSTGITDTDEWVDELDADNGY